MNFWKLKYMSGIVQHADIIIMSDVNNLMKYKTHAWQRLFTIILRRPNPKYNLEDGDRNRFMNLDFNDCQQYLYNKFVKIYQYSFGGEEDIKNEAYEMDLQFGVFPNRFLEPQVLAAFQRQYMSIVNETFELSCCSRFLADALESACRALANTNVYYTSTENIRNENDPHTVLFASSWYSLRENVLYTINQNFTAGANDVMTDNLKHMRDIMLWEVFSTNTFHITAYPQEFRIKFLELFDEMVQASYNQIMARHRHLTVKYNPITAIYFPSTCETSFFKTFGVFDVPTNVFHTDSSLLQPSMRT